MPHTYCCGSLVPQGSGNFDHGLHHRGHFDLESEADLATISPLVVLGGRGDHHTSTRQYSILILVGRCMAVDREFAYILRMCI